MDKRTRQELRRRCPTPEETDALLDMADERDAKDEEIASLIDAQADTREALEQAERERDRYRALLREARSVVSMAANDADHIRRICSGPNAAAAMQRRDKAWAVEAKVDAALEGKNND